MNVLGVMSGTSCDGLDLCLAKFSTSNNKEESYTILQTESYNYSKETEAKLKNAYNLNAKALTELEFHFTLLQAKYIADFINKYPNLQIDAIASHGHTVFHNPEMGYTKQILFGDLLAEKLNKTVVYDFRSQDVFLGGQGAPLVPIGDLHLFNQYEVCINLGGFANISYQANGNRIAYDICPFNILLNKYANLLGFPFDDAGKIAKNGKKIPELLKQLNSIEYYFLIAPKSLSVENLENSFNTLLNKYSSEKEEDILHTLVIHFADQISKVVNNKKNALVTGGGVFNSFFIDTLKEKTNCTVIIPKNDLINNKEALIFGFLGYLRLKNKINILSSVTGCKYNHSSGKIHYPTTKLKDD